MDEAETATSCPVGLTCASTQTIASSFAVAAMPSDSTRFTCDAPETRFEGACAKTYTLAFVPMSWVRGWIEALAVALVALTFAATVIGNTGEAAVARLAVKVP